MSINKVLTLGCLLSFLAGLIMGQPASHQQESLSTTERFDKTDNTHGWGLPSRTLEQVGADLVEWVSGHFKGAVAVGHTQPAEPVMPVAVVRTIDFRVLVPQLLRSTAGPNVPASHTVFVLRDSQGALFTASVEQYSGRYYVRAFGPAVDRTSTNAASPRVRIRLHTWPSDRLSGPRLGAIPVFIPYPFAADQIYYQIGDDPTSADFEDVETGQLAHGINAVIEGVAAAAPR